MPSPVFDEAPLINASDDNLLTGTGLDPDRTRLVVEHANHSCAGASIYIQIINKMTFCR